MMGLLFEPEFKKDWPDDPRFAGAKDGDRVERLTAESKRLFYDFESNGKSGKVFMAGMMTDDGPLIIDFRRDANLERAFYDGIKRRTGRASAFNHSFEQSKLREVGVELTCPLGDPMLGAYAVNEVREDYKEFGALTQKALVKYELGKEAKFGQAVQDWLRLNYGEVGERGWDKIPASLMFYYNLEDITLGAELDTKIYSQVSANRQEELVETDCYVADIVQRARERGMRFDCDVARQLIEECSVEFKATVEEMYSLMGRSFDFASPQKLFGLLYGEWRFPMHSDIEKEGKVDADVLKWLCSLPNIDPRRKRIMELVLHARELTKMKETYLMPWLYEWQQNGLLHPNMMLCTARTRRFTSNSPNLQNVPTRTELGAKLRRAFIPREGHCMVSMDESQAEYRFFAHLSGDKMLCDGYMNSRDFDIHQQVSDMLGIPRKKGKNTNFGILYGMGKDKLARSLLMDKAEAEAHLGRYYNLVPGLRRLREDLGASVKLRGYVQDAFGGRRHLKAQESYKALNTMCQMSVGDMMRRAMRRADPILRKAGGQILLQVHDELIMELPGTFEDNKAVLKQVKEEAMEDFSGYGFRVPFVSSVELWSPSWKDAVEVSV